MSFLAPAYLAALAAFALPWLLHRFNDARPEVRDFPSARFLEPTAPPVSRRRKLRHRALLALRGLVLAALCLLFAEPWTARPEALADARRLHVVAIDTSLSMRAGERFERALEIARERLGALPEGDAVQSVAFDRDVTPLSGEPGTAAEAAATLGRLSPGYLGADYGRLVQWLDRLADESPLPVRALIVSDAQRSALPARRNALRAPRLESLELLDVGADEANLALAARAASEDGAQARVSVTVSASASGAGDDPALARVVRVLGDGEVLARERVSLAPGERESVVFDRVTLPESSEPSFEVAFAEGDALAEDDAVEVPVRLGGARRVALAALDARVAPAARVFVTTALEAEGAASVDAAALASGQLPDAVPRLVAFTPLGGDALPAPLTRFVARGGSALVVDASERGGAFGEDAGTAAGATLEGRGVGRVDETHPLALGEIGWSGTRFFALGDYAPEEEERVLLETEDGEPVLIERPSEAGLMLVVNERLDGVDSNLPFQPAFVELMRRVVEWFDAGRAVPERLTVGDGVALPVNVQVLDPDGEALVALADTARARTLTLERPGLYTVVGALGEQRVAVTLDPAESDLATIDAEALAAWTSGRPEGADDGDAGAAPESAAGAAPPIASRLSLAPLLLPLLAALLLAETLFANRRLDVRRDGT